MDTLQLYHRCNLIEVALANDIGVTHFSSQMSTYDEHERQFRRAGRLPRAVERIGCSPVTNCFFSIEENQLQRWISLLKVPSMLLFGRLLCESLRLTLAFNSLRCCLRLITRSSSIAHGTALSIAPMNRGIFFES